ncbi:glucose 1-dehydrogenase [Halocatena salina]|uniref:Glucose 1-dehydrogenase n=1 Tax=Halocatena salina TaxID=2934340 RepID=A0A8U0A4E2_9EURY|nr:glucose 1-dehydrogenase [Halocatena salina]UPM44085.1 glucose 1-dehydrogenase [Halocatena salina]
MDAIAVYDDGDDPELIDVPRPTPASGEVLVRVSRVGIDGTDHEVIAGEHGVSPDDDDYLVLGHEAVGVIEDANGTAFTEGEVVVPMVRRPPGTENEYFQRDEPDMAPAGQYHERGIVGAHGYLCEYFTSQPEYLVSVPESVAQYGFLIEPVSIAEKALEHAIASRAAFEWTPESALVLGNGSLGLLTLAMLDRRGFDRTYCLGRRDRPDPTIDIIESLGATYVDSRDTPLSRVSAAYEPMDLVFEATGHAPHAFETVEALAPNGVGALVGVPGSHQFEIDGGTLHEELVLHNKALVGTVNSGRPHFERAVETLDSLPEWLLDDLVTDVVGVDTFERAFSDDDHTIKTAVEF